MLAILLGLLVVLVLTAATGYFVAQEFGYMAVDRSRLKAGAEAGDAGAARALRITRRTSFMLSGAQLGITVTGLLVGYVAEPLIGSGLGKLLGGVGVPATVGVAVGTVGALLLATVVQMVFGELFPKNLAIARPEPVARFLARSTAGYLTVFGWLIWLFDQASNLLLRAVRIEPVHDVEHAATPRDLEHIVAESRDTGDLPIELSTLLDRVLDFHDATAEHAMIARPQVTSIAADEPVSTAVEVMAGGHSRLPVHGEGVDDVLGVICLRDVLALDQAQRSTLTVREIARPALMVPSSLPLPSVLHQLRERNEEFAGVVDEYGGLAGVITLEDIAEELVGEITDEHDADTGRTCGDAASGWEIPGATHVDEVERLIGHDLPQGPFQTIGGLVSAELRRLPRPGDQITLNLAQPPGADSHEPRHRLTVRVLSINRRIAETLQLTVDEAAETDKAPDANEVRR